VEKGAGRIRSSGLINRTKGNVEEEEYATELRGGEGSNVKEEKKGRGSHPADSVAGREKGEKKGGDPSGR